MRSRDRTAGEVSEQKDETTRRLKILLIVEPGIDGVFRHVESLAQYLLSQTQEVHLAYSDRRSSERLKGLIELVQQRGGECINLRTGNAPEIGDLHCFWRLWHFARRLQLDVIHAHSAKAGVLGRGLALAGVGGSYFYTPHAYFGMAPRPGMAVHLYNLIERVFGRIGTTINISKDEAAFAARALKIRPSHSRLIENPVDAAKFIEVDNTTRLRQRQLLGLPEHATIVGAMGRLSFQKDPITLYRAMAPLLRDREELLLYHAGQGELEVDLRKIAEELDISGRIVRPPYFDEPAAFYQAIDCLVLTSRYEGCSNVLLEAMASGLPMIVSEAPGTSDITSANLSHCWAAKAGDVAGFTRALEAWLEDRSMQRESNHRDVAVQRFGEERCYGALLAEYREAVVSRSAQTESPRRVRSCG
ncbi:MAG: hypothetical protein QOG69_340 [Actinomycetota bacterium]|nr:hypothetical protein [Actinomycetota bacterium]